MFLQAEKAELPRILDYYKKDLRNCLYGYIDIKKYGIEDPNLNLYYSEKDGALNAVATEYYGGIQLYSFENRGDLESILSFLREKESPSINGSRELLEQIYPCLKAEYELAVGFVSRMGNGCLETEEPEEVEEAGEEDYLEIARLICSDRELGGLSDPGKLSRQFLKRSRERFGRHFIIRQDGEIVCHAATYAEADNLAVISGVITREDCRSRGLDGKTVGKLCRVLLTEGKTPHLFFYRENAGRLCRKLGFDAGTGWGRLLRREGEAGA